MSSQKYLPRASAFSSPHAIVDGDVYTVVKRDVTQDKTKFPLIPRALMVPSTSTVLPNVELHWIPNEHPFMFLIHLYPPFHGPLFDRLNYDQKDIPVVRIRRDKYALDANLKTEWITLERNLRAIAYAMAELCTIPLPKFFHFWSFPKRYGYQVDQPSKEIAQFVAARSRNAFLPLMAAVTLLLIILNKRENGVPGFTWRDRVLQKTGIHHHWLSMLESSVVGDLKLPRVGGIINMQRCEYKGLIPYLAAANLDMYLCWGLINEAPLRTLEWLINRGLVPNHHEIKHLRHLAKLHRPSPTPPPIPSLLPADPQPLSTTPDVNNKATLVFPPLDPSSKQKLGESWQDFFARRWESNQKKLSHEAPRQRQSRLAKEGVAAKHLAPGRAGANVFRWEDVKGFRVRRAVGYKFYNLWWTDYSRTQRRYDGFNDEWDVCTEFGDSNDPNSDDSDTDEELQDFYLNGSKSKIGETAGTDIIPIDEDFPLLPADQDEPDHQEGDYSSSADLMRVYDDDQDSDPVEMISEDFEHTMYCRFGFSPVATVQSPSSPVAWNIASKVLGDGRWRDSSARNAFPSQDVQNNICTFLGYLGAAKSIFDIPAGIFDIWQPESDIWKRDGRLRVRTESLDGAECHLIRSWANILPESAPMELSLRSPAALLEVLRRHQLGPDLDSVAEFLIDRGVPFNTFIRSHSPSPRSKVDPQYRGLGYRPPGYQPDAVDFRAYVSTRNNFLKTSRCRAALMSGGLVGRLAKDVVQYSQVYYGPSDAVFDEGFCLSDAKNSSLRYWDDQLTEDDLDIICGVYKIATGQYGPDGPQTTDISWWPKPSMWACSGLNVGYWSDDCERWYQNHFEKCMSEKPELRNPAQWRHSLRFTKEVSRLNEKNELRAAESFKHLLMIDIP